MSELKHVVLSIAVAHAILPLFLAVEFWALGAIPARADSSGGRASHKWFVGALLGWSAMALVRLAMPAASMPHPPSEWLARDHAWLSQPDLYVTWLSAVNNACFIGAAAELARASRSRVERRYVVLADLAQRAAPWVLAVDVAFATLATITIPPESLWRTTVKTPMVVDVVSSIATAVVLARVVSGVVRRDHITLPTVSRRVRTLATGIVALAIVQPALLVDWGTLPSQAAWIGPDAIAAGISSLTFVGGLLFVGSVLLWELGRERVENVIFRERVQQRMAALNDPKLRDQLSTGLLRLPASAAGNAVVTHAPSPEPPVPDATEQPLRAGWIALGDEGVLAWAATKQELRQILGGRVPVGVYFGNMPKERVDLGPA